MCAHYNGAHEHGSTHGDESCEGLVACLVQTDRWQTQGAHHIVLKVWLMSGCLTANNYFEMGQLAK